MTTWKRTRAKRRAVIILAAAAVFLLVGSSVSMAKDQTSIGDYDQLATFISGINDGSIAPNQDAVLTADITVPKQVGNGWVPLAADKAHAYQGTFDGQGHTISGISVDREYANPPKAGVAHEYTAFLSFLGEKGLVKNLNLNASISDVNDVGGIVSQNYGKISECTFQGTLHSDIYSDGLFEDSDGEIGCIAALNLGTIENCMTLKGTEVTRGGVNAGGIAGCQVGAAKIRNCVNNAKISIYQTKYKVLGVFIGGAGGIVGEQEQIEDSADATLQSGLDQATFDQAGVMAIPDDAKQGQPLVENCVNNAVITAEQASGGICGLSFAAIIRNCTNNGNIENVDRGRVGGIAGHFQAGQNVPAEMSGCVNHGNITKNTKKADYLGGIAGWVQDGMGMQGAICPAVVYNCKNTGNVHGRDLVGGVFGLLQNGMYKVKGNKETRVYQLVNTGKVTGTDAVGGAVGACPGVVADVINYGTVSGAKGEDSSCAIGGIAGTCSDTGRITDSYNMGRISVKELKGIPYVSGGIAGVTTDQLRGCSYCMDTSGAVKAANGIDTDDHRGMLLLQEMTGKAAAKYMAEMMDPKTGDHRGTKWHTMDSVKKDGKTYLMTPQFEGVEIDIDEIIASGTDMQKTSKEALPKGTKVTTKKIKYTYTGKEIKPAVTVKASSKTLKKGTDYIVYGIYKNVKAGTAEVLILGKGKYKGTAKGSFRIVPAKAVIHKAKAAKRSLKVTMKTKPSKCGGKYYQIQYRVKGSAKWKSVKTTKAKLTISKLKKGKHYQVRARAYKKVSGKVYRGAWSKVVTSKRVK